MKKIIVLLFISVQIIFSQDIVINEVMSSNSSTILDIELEVPDWIELYNYGSDSQNLTGYFLSDDSLNTKKWMFEDIVINPNGYLLIFASGIDTILDKLHTNFKLSASGESLFLSNSNGDVLDQIDIPSSITDVSYGRTSDASDTWIFQEPTPEGKNSGIEIQGFADEVNVSLPGGFYSSSISVELSAGDSEIYYTLDGSDPNSNSTKYSSTLTINETTILKAVGIKSAHLNSEVIFNTYFFNVDTHLPVISISTEPGNLFNRDTGIYIHYEEDWERPAHIEFYDDDKNLGFSENVGINIYGGYTRRFAQKSLAVKFKSKYGKNKLEYDLFPGFRLKEFKSFILRNSGNDFDQTHFRDAFMQTLIKDLDIDNLEYRPAVVYINGKYWGIQNIREKINEHYIANRHNVDPDNIDLLEGYSAYNDDRLDPNGEYDEWVGNLNAVHGDTIHYKQLIDYLYDEKLTTDEAYEFIDSTIDIDECLLYYAAHVYYNSQDWPANNSKYWRERTDNGKWRWIVYDLDFGFNLYEYNNEGNSENHVDYLFSGDPSQRPQSKPVESTFIPRKIVKNPKIRDRFINQVADLLNTKFKSDRVLNILNEIKNHISDDVDRHRNRWGLRVSGWKSSIDRMKSFANARPENLRNHVRNFFDAGEDCGIEVNSSAGGDIKLNTMVLSQDELPFTGLYFNETPVTLTAIPQIGYKFDGWSGDITSSDLTVYTTINRSAEIYANFSVDPNSSKSIVINEINYNSSDEFNPEDWIEFYNRSDQDVDISDWYLTDSDANHKFWFPAETVIKSGEYLVLVQSDSSFTALFPNVTNYFGEMNFGFSKGGESIKLVNNFGRVIDSLEYDDSAPWPIEPDGDGATLELFDAISDNTKPENWKASYGHGTPGFVNSVITDVEDQEIDLLPENYSLSQNFPNPFNPTTTISFDLPISSVVLLKVYNILGKEIDVLINEKLSGGIYSIIWDAKNYPSGVYFYSIKAGQYFKTKKMCLIK